jgi:hypothetical protein
MTNVDALTVDKAVEKYVELRDRKASLKAAYESEAEQLTELQGHIEQYIREKMHELGVTSFKTDHGTAFRQYKESATVADWDTILDYIKDNDAYHLLERRVSKTAVKDLMSERRDGTYENPPPPGVNFTRIESMGIRRKTR